jgi:hypothetical protein
MTCRAGSWGRLVISNGLVVAQAADGGLADRAGVGRQRGGGVVVDVDAAGGVPCAAEGQGGPSGGGQGGQRCGEGGVADAQGDEPDAAVVELGQDGLGGEPGIEDQ